MTFIYNRHSHELFPSGYYFPFLFLTSCFSSFVNPSFLSFTHFSLGLFFLLICKSSLYVTCAVCFKYKFPSFHLPFNFVSVAYWHSKCSPWVVFVFVFTFQLFKPTQAFLWQFFSTSLGHIQIFSTLRVNYVVSSMSTIGMRW